MNETSNNGKTGAVSLSDRVRSLRLPDQDETPAAKGVWWLPWVVVGVLVCISGLLALEAFAPIDDETIKKLAAERGLAAPKEASSNAAIARLGLPGTGDSSTEIALESKGYIVPISLIQVSPKISGTVMHLYIEEGKFVTKNFTLAKLEKVEYKSDLDRCKATVKLATAKLEELRHFRTDEVSQAKAEYDDAVAQRDQAYLKYTRSKKLRDASVIAPEDFEAAQSSYISMDSRMKRLKLGYELMMKGPRDEKIAAAQAEVGQAKADLDRAQWRFDNTEVKAPIDGVILNKKTEEGNIVNPSAFSNGLSASLCEMADLHKMEVDLSIAERDVAKLYKDQECRIRPEAFPSRLYKGYVSRIMPMADRAKGAIPVRVRIEFPAIDAKGAPLEAEAQGQYLRPEMGAIVTFLNRK